AIIVLSEMDMPEEKEISTFDIHVPDARINAESHWEMMRNNDTLYRSELHGGFYVAARFKDVMEVLMKPELYASGKGITLPPPDMIRSRHIPAEVEPPEHREYRNLIRPLLSGPRVKEMEAAIRKITINLLETIPSD